MGSPAGGVRGSPPTIREIMQRREEAIARSQAKINGTKARLITEHKGPNTEATPGADYQSDADLKKALGETHAHSISQWQAGSGVVGPTGEEDSWKFSWANKPHTDGYTENQNFGYQHDMQATDAELQAKTPEQKKAYADANYESAKKGFWVLKTQGPDQAMKRTQEIFKEHGFTVREHY